MHTMWFSFPVLVAFVLLLSISFRSEANRSEVEQKRRNQWISQSEQDQASIVIATLALAAAILYNIDIAGPHLYQLTVAGAATVFHRFPFSAARRRRTNGTHELGLFYYNGQNKKRPRLWSVCHSICSTKIDA